MFKYKSLLAAATLVALIMVGCNENTTDPTNNPAPNPVTGLMAASISESTVRLKWTAPTGTFASYIVRVNSTTADTTKLAAPSNTGSFDVTGLTGGTIYTFTVTSLNADGKESAITTIKWAGAKRFTTSNGNEIRVYESSSTKPSGLRLYDATAKEPVPMNTAAGDMWDIGFDNKGIADSIDTGSPAGLSFTINNPRATLIGKVYSDIDSLNQIFETADLSASAQARVTLPDASSKGFAMVVKTVEGNFAKVFVKSSGGKVLQGTSPDRYVVVEVSYQAIVGVPHADAVSSNGK